MVYGHFPHLTDAVTTFANLVSLGLLSAHELRAEHFCSAPDLFTAILMHRSKYLREDNL